MVNRYQSNPRPEYWVIVVQYIFNYLRKTSNYMLTYGGSKLIPIGSINFILCHTWILKSQLPSICSQDQRSNEETVNSYMVHEDGLWKTS